MKIIDLNDENKDLVSLCLEDWSSDAKEAGCKRREWIERLRGRGLRIKLAVDEEGKIGGMIQYLPIEQSLVDGADLYMIHCIWVHGHKEGRGNFQKHGMGKALLTAAEKDAQALGAKGMAAWGLWLPFWMKASWFKKHGYRKADRHGITVLMWKPFTDDAKPPKWYPRIRTLPDLIPGKVNITAFVNGWCLAQNLVYERAKRAAAAFGAKVIFQEIDTFERCHVAEWGISDAVLIDNKPIQKGPPPSYEKICKAIARRLKNL